MPPSDVATINLNVPSPHMIKVINDIFKCRFYSKNILSSNQTVGFVCSLIKTTACGYILPII